MTPYTLAIALVISVLSTFVATLIGLWPGVKAHRASNIVLGAGAVFGAVVGIAVATSNTLTLVLPSSLYPHAVAGATHVWPLFYGMVFGLDRFSAIFYALLSVVSVLVVIYLIPFFERVAPTSNLRSLNAVIPMFILGMQGVLLSTNIFGFMAFWEIMSITSFFLIVSAGTQSARQAGFLYLMMSHLGAGAMAAGLFVLSGGALLSDFSVLAMVTPQLAAGTLTIAMVLLFIGFGSQVGLFPFHAWLPGAHAQAPSPVAALFSGAMLNVALYGFLRVLLFLLPNVPVWFVLTVIALGLITALIGALYAAVERDVARLLAYGSIQNTGLLFTMLGVALMAGHEGAAELTQAALYAALFVAAAHALSKAGLFLVAGNMTKATGSRNLEDMGGLAQRMPWLSVAACVLFLSAAALPPAASFVGTWTFLQACVGTLLTGTPMLKVTLVIVVAAVSFVVGLGIFALVKTFAIGFLGRGRTDASAAASEPELGLLAPVVLLALLSLGLGVFGPLVLNRIGALSLAPTTVHTQTLTTGGGSLTPLTLLLVLAGLTLVGVLLRRLLSDIRYERQAETWNFGQPATARMEYTATAFSAPIRFFFRFFLRAQKAVTVTPLAPNNPWLASRSMELVASQDWYGRLYDLAGKGFTKLASWASRIQNGNIQFYIGLILLTLLVTLIIAL